MKTKNHYRLFVPPKVNTTGARSEQLFNLQKVVSDLRMLTLTQSEIIIKLANQLENVKLTDNPRNPSLCHGHYGHSHPNLDDEIESHMDTMMFDDGDDDILYELHKDDRFCDDDEDLKL